VAARFGGHELIQRIAVGGMAEVFLARKAGPEGFEKRVALKRILPHLVDQPSFVHRFLDEARLAARLDHPHIVHVYDFGRDGDSYWLAMEHVAGEDLHSISRRARREGELMSPADVATLLAQACEGLHHAHEQGIVHRDVSPSNLLLSWDGVVKLADFGVAQTLRPDGARATGTLEGKLAYMSPEQARGEPIDRRSDLYSLGVCGWELATGRRLRGGNLEPGELLGDVRRGEVPRPSTVRELPRELEQILLNALDRDPARRFSTARALGEALRGWVASRGETTSPARLAAYLRRLYGPDARDRTRTLELPLDVTAPLEAPARRSPRRVRRLVPLAAAAAITLLLVGAARMFPHALAPAVEPAPGLAKPSLPRRPMHHAVGRKHVRHESPPDRL
jgi:serine/threonine-protein kinase